MIVYIDKKSKRRSDPSPLNKKCRPEFELKLHQKVQLWLFARPIKATHSVVLSFLTTSQKQIKLNNTEESAF